jgi:replication factor A1
VTVSQVAVKLVPFEQLPKFVNRRATVDLCGIITSVGVPGSIKRKADNTELPKREVTLVDRGCKSVTLTLWGTNASGVGAQLDGQEGHVLICTVCKVGEYNGGSPPAGCSWRHALLLFLLCGAHLR